MIGETAFAAVGLLFLLGALRALTSVIYHSLYLGLALPNAVVAGAAFGALGLSLGALAVARAGPRRAIGGSAGVLALATLLGAALRNEWLWLAIWTAGTAAGTWWLALLHASRAGERPSPLPLALPLALACDLVLRTAFGTVAVVDLPLATALPVVVAGALVLLASGVAALGPERAWASPGPRGALGLLALPALLLVSETGGTNAAQIAAAAGLGLDGGPGAEIGALAVGLGIALGFGGLARPPVQRRPLAALLVVGGAALLWARLPVASLAGGVVLAAGVVQGVAALTAAPLRPARSPALVGVALFVGWLVLAACAFAYYALYDLLPALWAATALATLAVLAVPAARDRVLAPLGAGLAAALVVLVPTAALLSALATAPVAVEVPAAATFPFRLMTWNVNQGFDGGEVPGIDAIVETIAREAPDVVVLQEVTRGWLINERHDLLGILAARLRMRYVFGPQIGDLYGNALLSRLPVSEVERAHYPKEPGLRYQPRGALLARVAGTEIVVTHLDHNADASPVRQDQVRALLGAWNGRLPAIVVGDLNALPGSPELRLLADAGFRDLAEQSGALELTFPADRPAERIDYAWGIGVTAAQTHVVATTASDHRPLVLNVTPSR